MSHKAAGERTAGAELDLEPIKARLEFAREVWLDEMADARDFLDASDPLVWKHIPALLAEVERLRAALRSQPEGKNQTDVE